MFKKILNYFEQKQWEYKIPDANETFVMLSFNTTISEFYCVLYVDEQENIFTFHSILPTVVPVKLRKQVAELLIRLNYSLFIGNFEMDFEDGQIQCKTSLSYQDGEVTEKMLSQLIDGNIGAMDNNFALLMGFITKKISMLQAKKMIVEASS